MPREGICDSPKQFRKQFPYFKGRIWFCKVAGPSATPEEIKTAGCYYLSLHLDKCGPDVGEGQWGKFIYLFTRCRRLADETYFVRRF